MAGLIQWALERNVTITITGLNYQNATAGYDGTFAEDSAVLGPCSFNGRIRSHSGSYLTSPHNRGVPGFVSDNRWVEDEVALEIEELASALPLVATGASQGFGFGNILRVIFMNFRYVKITVDLFDNAGTPDRKQRQTIYGLITGLNEHGTKPEVVDTMSIICVQPVNIGAANTMANTYGNPTYDVT